MVIVGKTASVSVQFKLLNIVLSRNDHIFQAQPLYIFIDGFLILLMCSFSCEIKQQQTKIVHEMSDNHNHLKHYSKQIFYVLRISIFYLSFWRGSIVTIRADFQQGMESMSPFKMNTVTKNYWLVYAAATVIWPYHVGYYFQSLS